MRRYLSSLGILGLLAIGMPSTAMAGGALVASLTVPMGSSAVDCAMYDPCESDGFGSTATLKVKGINNMSFIIEGMLPSTSYSASLAAAGCGNVIATFPSSGSGTVNHTAENLVTAPDVGDLVEICRQDSVGSWQVIYSGTLGRLNGR